MSINDFSNKIKGKIDIDNYTILCLFVILFVGLASFGLGRMSVEKDQKNDNISIMKNDLSQEDRVGERSQNNFTEDSKQKMYVASKNGKLYYSMGCSGAKRISPNNEVWFANKKDAEDAGYKPANCN